MNKIYKDDNSNSFIQSMIKNEDIDENIDKYYDIPIKNVKKLNSNTHKENYLKSMDQYIEDDDGLQQNDVSKNRMIDEILRESYRKALNESTNRPFTPPFSKFNNIDTESQQKTSRRDIDEMTSNSTAKVTKDDEYIFYKGDIKEDLIFDPDLGCYYNPQTNNFYDIEMNKGK